MNSVPGRCAVVAVFVAAGTLAAGAIVRRYAKYGKPPDQPTSDGPAPGKP